MSFEIRKKEGTALLKEFTVLVKKFKKSAIWEFLT